MLDFLFELFSYLTTDIPEERSKKRKLYILLSVIIGFILIGAVIISIVNWL